MAAPAGTVPCRLKVNVLAGLSASVAVAVNVSVCPTCTDLLPMGERTGGTLTSLTVMAMVSSANKAGAPLSVTRTVTGNVPGPWASVGTHVNTPVV